MNNCRCYINNEIHLNATRYVNLLKFIFELNEWQNYENFSDVTVIFSEIPPPKKNWIYDTAPKRISSSGPNIYITGVLSYESRSPTILANGSAPTTRRFKS